MKNVNLVLILLTVGILSACKINQNQDPSKDNSISGINGIEIQSEREFNSNEVDIVQRVCRSLKSKREFFQTLGNMEEKFKFNLKNTNCEGGVYSDFMTSAFISNANSTDLEYVFDGVNYNSNIITDQTNGVKNLCDQTANSKLKNRVTVDKNVYAFNVYILKGYDIFEMSRMIRDSSGVLNLKTSEKIAFITQSNQALSKFVGVEKDRVKSVVCGLGKYSTTTQTWLSAITSF